MNRYLLAVSLYVFAGCAGLGLIPSAVLAAKARKPWMALAAFLAAAYVIYVLAGAAGRIR